MANLSDFIGGGGGDADSILNLNPAAQVDRYQTWVGTQAQFDRQFPNGAGVEDDNSVAYLIVDNITGTPANTYWMGNPPALNVTVTHNPNTRTADLSVVIMDSDQDPAIPFIVNWYLLPDTTTSLSSNNTYTTADGADGTYRVVVTDQDGNTAQVDTVVTVSTAPLLGFNVETTGASDSIVGRNGAPVQASLTLDDPDSTDIEWSFTRAFDGGTPEVLLSNTSAGAPTVPFANHVLPFTHTAMDGSEVFSFTAQERDGMMRQASASETITLTSTLSLSGIAPRGFANGLAVSNAAGTFNVQVTGQAGAQWTFGFANGAGNNGVTGTQTMPAAGFQNFTFTYSANGTNQPQRTPTVSISPVTGTELAAGASTSVFVTQAAGPVSCNCVADSVTNRVYNLTATAFSGGRATISSAGSSAVWNNPRAGSCGSGYNGTLHADITGTVTYTDGSTRFFVFGSYILSGGNGEGGSVTVDNTRTTSLVATSLAQVQGATIAATVRYFVCSDTVATDSLTITIN